MEISWGEINIFFHRFKNLATSLKNFLEKSWYFENFFILKQSFTIISDLIDIPAAAKGHRIPQMKSTSRLSKKFLNINNEILEAVYRMHVKKLTTKKTLKEHTYIFKCMLKKEMLWSGLFSHECLKSNKQKEEKNTEKHFYLFE